MQPRCNRFRGIVSGMAKSTTKSYVPLMAAALAGIATTCVLLLVLVFLRSTSTASAATTGTTAEATASASSNGLPPLSGSGGGLEYMIRGRVAAVSATSITLAGNGPSITASINGSTRFTGQIMSASGIKVGDEVSAQLSGKSQSSLVASTIDDSGQTADGDSV